MEVFPGITMNPEVRFGKPCSGGASGILKILFDEKLPLTYETAYIFRSLSEPKRPHIGLPYVSGGNP